jgi:hypothetical protein
MPWPMRDDYKAGQSLRAVAADDLGTAMRILNDMEVVNLVLYISPNGKAKLTANLSTTDFSVAEKTRLITTSGVTVSGTIEEGTVITVENGLIKEIAPLA